MDGQWFDRNNQQRTTSQEDKKTHKMNSSSSFLRRLILIATASIVVCASSSCSPKPPDEELTISTEKNNIDNDCLPQSIHIVSKLQKNGLNAVVCIFRTNKRGHAIAVYEYPKNSGRIWGWDEQFGSVQLKLVADIDPLRAVANWLVIRSPEEKLLAVEGID
jgi:hypothetical protein